jgi:hypothetical protein
MCVLFLHWAHRFFTGTGFGADGGNAGICLLCERTPDMLKVWVAINAARFAKRLQGFGKGAGKAVHDTADVELESLSVF